MISDIGEVFGDILGTELFEDMVAGRCLAAETTHWAWSSQIIDFNSSCTEAVARIQTSGAFIQHRSLYQGSPAITCRDDRKSGERFRSVDQKTPR